MDSESRKEEYKQQKVDRWRPELPNKPPPVTKVIWKPGDPRPGDPPAKPGEFPVIYGKYSDLLWRQKNLKENPNIPPITDPFWSLPKEQRLKEALDKKYIVEPELVVKVRENLMRDQKRQGTTEDTTTYLLITVATVIAVGVLAMYIMRTQA